MSAHILLNLLKLDAWGSNARSQVNLSTQFQTWIHHQIAQLHRLDTCTVLNGL